MVSRVILVFLTLFWVTMNVLLWRAEYGTRARGGAVPPEVVWHKMLTAPDSSSLSVYHHGRKIGFCQWTTTVGQEMNQLREQNPPPEGMVKRVGGYQLQLEGNIAWGDFTNRLRFEGSVSLATNYDWQQFSLRVNLRPDTWEIRTDAAEETLRLTVGEGGGQFQRVFKFSELRNPERLLGEVAGPLAALALTSPGLEGGLNKAVDMLSAVKWEAREGSIKIGISPVRAYWLEGHLLEHYRAVITVSRAGEVLRVELPDEVLLTNDQMVPFN